MIHLFINGLAASAGGGVTYIRNLVPQLAKRPDVRTTVLLNPALKREMHPFSNVVYLEQQDSSSAALRFWNEQLRLPGLIRQSRAHVLLSAGNFALRHSPVPQILLSRNSLYTSGDFYRDLLARRHYAVWLDTKIKGVLARQSITWADCTVAPSYAFTAELKAWAGVQVETIYHGFDRETFFSNAARLNDDVEQKLRVDDGALRLLFVSHYNYYRNFETLLRAIPLIRRQLKDRPLKLFLTCALESRQNPGSYRAETAAALIARLGIRDSVIELGSIPYAALHQVYRSCDIYVTPAYTETFAHPLVESMACGLPVAASDIAVHREICGEAALYFERFSAQALAERVIQVARSNQLFQKLSEWGVERSLSFSWERHCAEIIALAQRLLGIARSAAA
jgi:glycosyltransferase involved in cell wall biosynthesis